jgi:chemotaxis protein CheC
MNFHLGPRQLDILKEVGNIGAGHAAMALSTMMQQPIQVSVTAARLCSFDEIADVVGGPEQVVVGLFLRLGGDIEGNMLLMLSHDSAHKLVGRLLNQDSRSADFTEMELSALAELGNILGGSYMNAVSELASLHLYQSVPAVAIDMAGAILDIGIAATGEYADSAILIDTRLFDGQSAVDGHFFLLPDPPSTTPLLRALGDIDA